ncbi:hypothetical protein ACFYTS_27460 [Nocardia sp. NPDC004151]|uniref:hypothetical protein n=1 Tax=Nocardia sp. NPDC004151 TaxID=3364304 RepID=UPI00367EA52F
MRQSIRKMLVQSFGIAAVLAAVMAAAPAAHAGAIFPLPDPDGFYYAAGNLDAARNGDVLNSRQVPAHPFPGATVWRILFRSTNSNGAPIAAVTTLISPGPGPRPLLSYQPFVNSLGLQCAPSHSLIDGSLKESSAFPLPPAKGWAIAVPELIHQPLCEWHDGNDQVPLDLAQYTAGRDCAAGTPVQFDVIPGADHGTAIFSGTLNAMNYLSDRFAGLAPPSNCR